MEKEFLRTNKNEISLLISDKENEIWRIIHSTINDKKYLLYSVDYVEQLVLSYIFISDVIGEKLPYRNMKEFFCYYNDDGIREYDEFLKCALHQKDKNFDEDKLIFLLNHTEGEICRFIFAVLNDSDEDPHFSAVYATNMIKCFINITSRLSELLYNDVCGFFITHGFSQKHYFDFEKKRKKESAYYRGIQW